MILEFSHFSLAHCVDFNYRAGDKTDQTSIGDKTGRGRAKLYKVKIRGRWGRPGLLLFSGIERREIVNSNLRPCEVVPGTAIIRFSTGCTGTTEPQYHSTTSQTIEVHHNQLY